MDHGQLNIPLAKRGNIDAQIDAYKIEQAHARKVTAKERAARVSNLKASIKGILAALPDDRVLALAAPLGKKKASTARVALYQAAGADLARWQDALMRDLAATMNRCCSVSPCARLEGPCCDMAGRCAKCRARYPGCNCSPEEWMGY
ncbi:hypothetical protein [Novosphingobium sp. Leaf2]|uniref:hypothetical protein n=1 Tax=Novosphingobium sp. Leaf2 TaxID=1735670 RepID=UPI0006F2D991|nr:hypothetical protein [Novosphingobium sp. Leaf2]